MDGVAHRGEDRPAGLGGTGAILLTLTGVGSIVPLVLLWVFASCAGRATIPRGALPGYSAAPAGGQARPAPPRALARLPRHWPTGGHGSSPATASHSPSTDRPQPTS